MSATYQPICSACRGNNPIEFRKGCEGCRVRQVAGQAPQLAPDLTDKQVDGMDSTMQPLEDK
ncbi:hypothetical protein [Variovorax sp. W2I14]|uniref:hypothetical protein n=1 Tax=Variovorax sp. W2I14 TaxID=3042290 RepID=UPI003D1E53A6